MQLFYPFSPYIHTYPAFSVNEKATFKTPKVEIFENTVFADTCEQVKTQIFENDCVRTSTISTIAYQSSIVLTFMLRVKFCYVSKGLSSKDNKISYVHWLFPTSCYLVNHLSISFIHWQNKLIRINPRLIHCGASTGV